MFCSLAPGGYLIMMGNILQELPKKPQREKKRLQLHFRQITNFSFSLQFWRQGKGDYFQGIMFMAELSTPSVCLGKILIQVSLGLASNKISECLLHVHVSHWSPSALSTSLFHFSFNGHKYFRSLPACSLFMPVGFCWLCLTRSTLSETSVVYW